MSRRAEAEAARTPAPDVRPLYAAGFVTAFGAHGVAATWGAESAGAQLLHLGLLVAVYDLAEVLLKPVFGALADRVGPRPVITGGLLGFAAVSFAGVVWSAPVAVILVRFGQGAAASAFSPAASAAVARLASPERRGRAFGRYGSWKSLGYVGGPILGAALALVGGIGLLQLVLGVLGLAVAVWVLLRCPDVVPLPRRRPTVLDVLRESADRRFLGPVVALAAAAGTLVAAIGFLPAQSARLQAGVVGAAGAASVLALALAITQPLVGRWIDRHPGGTRWLGAASLVLCAAGLLIAAWAPTLLAVLLGALVIGLGVAGATPSGYSSLAAVTAPEHMGRTMGTAEMGRELGDAAAPALVGAVGAAVGLASGLAALAVLVLAAAGATALISAGARETSPGAIKP